jgi:histidyl-tRNA synthetase
MGMSRFNAIRGFKDIPPEEAPLWRRLEEAARNVARRYDFEELRVPVAERTEVFARSIGEATDIVEKEMYTFTDKGGERLTLRPEATAGMMRAVLEHNLAEGGRPARLFCFGPMFRYERPQKGRLRQFHQLDAEIYGDPGPGVDAELLAYLAAFLRELGLDDLSISLNSLGCPACRPAFRAQLWEFLAARAEALCPDCRQRLERSPLRVIDCKNEACREVVRAAPRTLDHLCPDCAGHFEALKDLLAALGLPFKVEPLLVRGLDYYTRTAFEVLSGDLGAQNAVAGGGRYDGLARELGGGDLPAVGFAVGLERLVLLLRDRAKVAAAGPDCYLAVLHPAAALAAFKLAEDLRGQGLRVAADWTPGSLKSRLKRADKLGAARVFMLGEDEMARRQATVRDLVSHEQSLFDLTPYLT